MSFFLYRSISHGMLYLKAKFQLPHTPFLSSLYVWNSFIQWLQTPLKSWMRAIHSILIVIIITRNRILKTSRV